MGIRAQIKGKKSERRWGMENKGCAWRVERNKGGE